MTSSIHRIYKFNPNKNYPNQFNGVIEIEYNQNFRLRQGIHFAEVTEIYFLDENWNLPQYQSNHSRDSWAGKKMMFVFFDVDFNKPIILEFLENDKVILQSEITLKKDSWPKSSFVNLIKGIKKQQFHAHCKFKEYQGIVYFPNKVVNTTENTSVAITKYFFTDENTIKLRTLNIEMLSAIHITNSLWAGRGFPRTTKFGNTVLYYGETTRINDESSWHSIPVPDFQLREIFIDDNTIHLLTSDGLYIVRNNSIAKDESFSYHKAVKELKTFYGLFEFQNKPAVIFDKHIFIKSNKKWEPIYKFIDSYSYDCSAISFDNKEIYFVADRKLWVTDLKSTFQIAPKINGVMKISKGPNQTILYKQDKSKGNKHHGGIYFPKSNRFKPLKRDSISEIPDLMINNIFFIKDTEKIMATSYAGLFEFELSNWMKN